MKKCIEIIISVFVLAIGLALPVSAQATYSCGAYGAGDYSTNDCSEDNGGGDGGTTGGGTNTGSGESTTGGEGSAPQNDTNSGGDSGVPNKDETNAGKDPEGDIFAVIFAKLATSWGWLALFGGLLIAGVVLIGLIARRRRAN